MTYSSWTASRLHFKYSILLLLVVLPPFPSFLVKYLPKNYVKSCINQNNIKYFRANQMKTPNKKSRHQIQDEFDRTILIEDKSYGQKVVGYLTNFKTLGFIDKTNNEERTGMLCYFVGEDGVTFKTILKFSPYFYLSYREGYEK